MSMSFKIIFVILMVSSGLVSCDPGQILIVKAAKNGHASVSMYGKKRMLPSNYSNEKIVMTVPAKDSIVEYEKEFNYRIGIWDKRAIDQLTSAIDSIIIINTQRRVVLGDSATIRQYLASHRSGELGNVITIEAK
jgi:hypothetical protein